MTTTPLIEELKAEAKQRIVDQLPKDAEGYISDEFIDTLITHTAQRVLSIAEENILEAIRKAVAVDLGPDGMCEIEIGTTRVRSIIKNTLRDMLAETK